MRLLAGAERMSTTTLPCWVGKKKNERLRKGILKAYRKKKVMRLIMGAHGVGEDSVSYHEADPAL